ncbi:MAG: tetratricopeptide repeat protein [Chloroflexota bacterium]
MSRPNQSTSKKPEQIETFEEHVDTLFEELAFAIQWQRPSILLAFCESEYIRATVELALEKRLVEIGQAFVRFTVNAKRFDIPQLLAKRSDRDRSVYSVTGLSKGGGQNGANAYRALNIRREYFVDFSIRALFWLTKGEAKELSRAAPDFWVFRHRVVEFTAPSGEKDGVFPKDDLHVRDQGPSSQSINLDEQIVKHETLLADLPADGSVATRLDLLNTLAVLYQEKGEYQKSIQRLKQGANLAQQEDSVDLAAQFCERLGLAYLNLNNPKSAIRAYRKATRLTPEDAGRWSSLGHTYLVQGRTDAARSAFRKAIKFNPQDATPWAGLGQAYRAMNRTKDAVHAYQKAVQFAPQDADNWNSLGNLYIETEQTQDAFEACNKAAKFAPQNVLAWNNLGLIYRMMDQFSDAIIAYQQSLALDPHNLAALVSLAACYRLSGKDDLTKQQIKLARPILKNESEYNKAVFESVCGNINKAINFLTKAVEEKRADVNMLQRDLNLDFIRSDPRFELLLKTINLKPDQLNESGQ